MIISETYFKGIIDIDYSKPSTKEEIRYYSETVSEIYLKLLLGHTQYNDYVANKTAEKYVNLIKAETFTYNEETYANDIKQMLAYFLYVELTQDSQSYNTTMGEMSSTTDNAARNLSVRKLQRACSKPFN